MKLNLGCGTVRETGLDWINCDLRSEVKPDLVCDARKLPFKDNSLDHIYAFNILDHFNRFETTPVLKEWLRVLKPSGNLRIIVPDFRFAVEAYMSGKHDMERMQDLYGGQEYKYNFHYTCFDQPYLSKVLLGAGFSRTQNEATGHYGGLQMLAYKG